MRPDFNNIARQQRHIAQHVGETAMWRKYVSASAGNPAYGIGNEPRYVQRTVTGLFNPVPFEEMQQGGGQFVAGDMHATLIDCQPNGSDELIWRGTTYRVESDFIPERLLGASAYRGVLRRGDATG
jgi:hypothetical protein